MKKQTIKLNSKLNTEKLLKLTWKKVWILIIIGFLSILLHNLIYALTGIEEAFFFIIVVFLVPLYFIISLIYSLIAYFVNRK
jgi:hypothetical protein